MTHNIDPRILQETETPFYFYDSKLLDHTLDTIKQHASKGPFKVHYAIKANSNGAILRRISSAGFGADCVSGGEINAAIDAGFAPADIFYAGVGKTDREILLGLHKGIGCFNVESIEELDIIAEIASREGIVAPVALRVNPDIDAHTHHYITTGLEENKFGIDMRLLDRAIEKTVASPWLRMRGLHFHIGSQITITEPFVLLCERINTLTANLRRRGIALEFINVGGGLGIDYDDPDANPVADFAGFFDVVAANLHVEPGQEIHCEPGRAVVAQCGSLITRVLYVKEGIGRRFAIVDAGMTDLLRPALYGAHHRIERLTTEGATDTAEATARYDVVGPVCESTDTFAVDEPLPELHRGDILALRSAGAYGESMASTYNRRPLPRTILA